MNKLNNFLKGKSAIIIVIAVVVLWVFGKQVNKLFAWLRDRLQSAISSKSVAKKVAQDSGTSTDTVASQVRQETCIGVASAVYAALHEEYFGFLPSSIFGSKQDGDEVVSELNSLANGLEAKYVSSYYAEKYGRRLRDEIVTYSNKAINYFVAGYKSIKPEIWNNIT